MKKTLLLFPLLALFACENSDIDITNQEENVHVDKDQLIASTLTPKVLEPVRFQFTAKKNDLPINQLYDSITFSVSGIDKELRVLSIFYDDTGSPMEVTRGNWNHYFMVAGNYQTLLYGYKNSVKTTLVVLDLSVSQPFDFYNIDWNNFIVGKKTYNNETGKFSLYTEVKMIGSNLNIKPITEVTYGFANSSWPYSETINEQGKAMLYSHMTQTFGLPTYTEVDNLKALFDENFTTNLPEYNLVHNIWLTDKNKIALLEVRAADGMTLNFKLYAEKK